jgi:(p)ppGpp synthase/HD superfamily hydrolase
MGPGPAFQDALRYALDLHRRQLRKGGAVPYAAHLLGVAALVLQFGGDEEQAIAGLLHDAVEDQGGLPTLEAIRARFGARVARLVEGCTDSHEDPKPPWRRRKEAYLARLPGEPAEVLLVSACDKLDNARAILSDLRAVGPAVWERFAGGRDSLWYYRAAADALARAGRGSPAARVALELDRVVREIEALAAAS